VIEQWNELSAGHRRMLSILHEIKERAPDEHLFYGQRQPEKLRRKLAALGPQASPLELITALHALGYAEIWYEPTPRRAIERLTQAKALLAKLADADAGWSKRLKFHLAVAYLRLGETENCCLRANAESCILPIQGGGVHSQEEGSRQAIKYFLEVLEETRLRQRPTYLARSRDLAAERRLHDPQ
jgi:hypothetical protein